LEFVKFRCALSESILVFNVNGMIKTPES
jgi:hypothetical protein